MRDSSQRSLSAVHVNYVDVLDCAAVLFCVPNKGVPYWHQSQEVWLAPNGTTIICDTSGEDKHCSDSVPLLKTHPADHTSYYGWNAGPCNV